MMATDNMPLSRAAVSRMVNRALKPCNVSQGAGWKFVTIVRTIPLENERPDYLVSIRRRGNKLGTVDQKSFVVHKSILLMKISAQEAIDIDVHRIAKEMWLSTYDTWQRRRSKRTDNPSTGDCVPAIIGLTPLYGRRP